MVIADEAHRTQYGFKAKTVDDKNEVGEVVGQKMCMVLLNTGAQNQWPAGYFDLFDAWVGEPQARPSELALETRASFN